MPRLSQNQARGWGAKMFKKLYQSGMDAKFTMVTWRGDDGVVFNGGLNYHQNVINAFNAAPALASYVDTLSGEKIMMAHSLGNMVVSSAWKHHGMRVEKYFAFNAAVAAEAFDASTRSTGISNPMVHPEWHDYLPKTWASEWHSLFDEPLDADWRGGLTWENCFSTLAGNLYNYYSTGDEVLELYYGGELWGDEGGFSRYAWQKQERFKGRGNPHGTIWAGWEFERNFWGRKVYRVAQANALNNDDLIRAPVFSRIPWEWLSEETVLAFPDWPAPYIELLAKGIPALSQAMGGRSVCTQPVYPNPAVPNIDMNLDDNGGGVERPNGWPQIDRGYEDRNRWLHSDVKNVAYYFTYKLFKQLVDEGGLK